MPGPAEAVQRPSPQVARGGKGVVVSQRRARASVISHVEWL